MSVRALRRTVEYDGRGVVHCTYVWEPLITRTRALQRCSLLSSRSLMERQTYLHPRTIWRSHWGWRCRNRTALLSVNNIRWKRRYTYLLMRQGHSSGESTNIKPPVQTWLVPFVLKFGSSTTRLDRDCVNLPTALVLLMYHRKKRT